MEFGIGIFFGVILAVIVIYGCELFPKVDHDTHDDGFS
ncbi:hypothetical protein Marme_2807 [Marinomonas mediterranea MMB-1]|jgi:hypothetical protein|uniref:Uncharacterized protein n=1 Tax=Marinomonas mediterranea (strain ATCC 700492 / JCM 21426 / NBRC 103028 / MMB-1) TaxID=717774 RepID=F2JZ52_MARM1|nr:hypothetical protein Marme_2807 [Marinomonas mediterranea MMB-1]